MKLKDLIAALRDYPTLRQALEESNAELDLSRMECAQLQSKINELEPLVDEYYQESCGKGYEAKRERQKTETLKKAFVSFCPALDSTEQLRRFYDSIAPAFDDGGFRLYEAALAISGYPNLPGEFPYEDNRGVFDEADGHQLLKYLTALHFHAVRWEVVPGTPYEKAVLLDVDTATPEYRAFEKQLYTQALRDLGFQGLLPQEQERRIGKQKEKRKEGAER